MTEITILQKEGIIRLRQLLSARTVGLVGTCVVIASCAPDKTAVEKAIYMAERCWGFVDDGDFIARGLYWVRDAEVATYDDRVYGMRVSFQGETLDELSCEFTSYPDPWTAEEVDSVFQEIARVAPEWVASRENTELDAVRPVVFEDEANVRYEYYGTELGKGAFVIQSQERASGHFRLAVGKSNSHPH